MENEKIIELFFDRSETAIEVLSEKYGKLCLYLANNILRQPQEAEECANDAYLGVWNTIPPQRPQHLKSFVCRIVHHLACKRVEHEQAQKRQSNYGTSLEELNDTVPDTVSLEDTVQAEFLKTSINDFLAQQDPLNRILFVRHYWMADSYEQLDALTGLKTFGRKSTTVMFNGLKAETLHLIPDQAVTLTAHDQQ